MKDENPSRYRTGHSLGTTVYRVGDDQPCGWFPNDPGLADLVVRLLNHGPPQPFPASNVKVVRRPDREVACGNCKCVLSYQMEDTQIGGRGANYGGDTPEPARYIKCPECDSTVWVEERP